MFCLIRFFFYVFHLSRNQKDLSSSADPLWTEPGIDKSEIHREDGKVDLDFTWLGLLMVVCGHADEHCLT